MSYKLKSSHKEIINTANQTNGVNMILPNSNCIWNSPKKKKGHKQENKKISIEIKSM